jgi:D-alanyl-D-alanine carboxypeptidase
MFERFTRDARAVVADAHDQAAALGANRVEAEHLLLALADRAVAGLDRARIESALEDEQRRSLAAVGVTLDDFDLPRRSSVATKVRFGASAKRALELTLRVALERGDRRIQDAHILLALLRAEAGTVPRALAIAGIDAAELTAAATRTLR